MLPTLKLDTLPEAVTEVPIRRSESDILVQPPRFCKHFFTSPGDTLDCRANGAPREDRRQGGIVPYSLNESKACIATISTCAPKQQRLSNVWPLNQGVASRPMLPDMKCQ